MSFLSSLLKIELRPSDDNLMPVLHEILDQLLEVQRARTTVHESHIVHREAGLKRRILVKHVQDDIGIRILLETDHDTDTLHRGFVIDVCDSFYLLAFHKLCDLLDHLTLVHHVRDLSHDYCLATRIANFDICLGTDHYPSPTCLECILDALPSLDDASCREIRTLDILHQFFDGDLRIVYVGTDGITALGKIVRRHIGRHTYRDS